MNLPLIALYTWNQKEFVRAEVLSVRNSPLAHKFFLIMRVIGLLIWLIGFIIFFATESSWYELIIPVPLGFGFVALPWFVEQWARKVYEKRGDRDMVMTWEIHEDRMVCRTQANFNTIPWAKIERLVHVREGFLLYPKETAFQWIPVEAFRDPEGAGMFAILAASKVKNFVRVD